MKILTRNVKEENNAKAEAMKPQLWLPELQSQQTSEHVRGSLKAGGQSHKYWVTTKEHLAREWITRLI
jgi:hypothetical protein